MNPGHSLPSNLDEWLHYIEALHSKDIELGLQRVQHVAQRLNLRANFPIITVAGTNGKGSSCAMLAQIYQHAGYKVASYTSPHLIDYRERICINQQMISEPQACTAFAAVEQARAGTPLTYFEFGTLAAMYYFLQQQVDVAILEIGMGGRLDAVNLFEPDCSIVTSIDLDHMEYLGNTREAIGREKAGIYRSGKPAICADRNAPQSLIDYAQQIDSEFYLIGQHFDFQASQHHWQFDSQSISLPALPMPGLTGAFQLNNASAVMMALHLMQGRLPISWQTVAQAFPQIRLAGRYQTIHDQPRVIVDVAHNPHAAQALLENLRAQPCAGKTIAVMAMLGDKDIAAVARLMQPVIDVWYLAALEHSRGASLQQTQQAVQASIQQQPIICQQNLTLAFHEAYKQAGENDRIIVFGSFFTVATIMRILLD